MELHHRAVSREQMRRFEGYLAEIFAACGLNLNTPATEETPRRFLQALFEATEGYDGEPKLLKVFNTECRGNPDRSEERRVGKEGRWRGATWQKEPSSGTQ